jgi:hypothetical protein
VSPLDKKVVASGVGLVVLAELTAFVLGRRWALPISGAAVVLFALELRGRFAGVRGSTPGGPATDDADESLQRWRSHTETLIQRADSTRADWDRHLRPKLAREFVLATRQKDPAALAATGRMVFGEELWPWVDPQNVSRSGRDEPGPGRAVLDELLRRLEKA